MQAGLDMEQLRTLLRRWPTGMTYTVSHWRMHLAYFASLGVPAAALPQVRTALCARCKMRRQLRHAS